MTRTNRQTYRVYFKDGSTVLIDAQSEGHARQAITRGRKVGRYSKSRITRIEVTADSADC